MSSPTWLTGRRLAVAAVALGVIAVVLWPEPTHSCGDVAFAPNSEDGIYEIWAKGLDCDQAIPVARAVRPVDMTRGPHAYRAGAFSCKGTPRNEGLLTVLWTCSDGSRRITFRRA